VLQQRRQQAHRVFANLTGLILQAPSSQLDDERQVSQRYGVLTAHGIMCDISISNASTEDKANRSYD